ncbi:hypothetical protein IW261DRAFT_1417893 [Armillaria novae-zelandiae]|uniref:Uncharacterized protein n=1 Tax=Armillaria novae-zelandiae TaxID=153914 RepID=A0AA39PDL2_9AGAR|nr:hypothetical protein IW261DRAFT_1417893 [Armillaria novae-zelandiae]
MSTPKLFPSSKLSFFLTLSLLTYNLLNHSTDTLRPFNTMLCRRAAGMIELHASSQSQSRLSAFDLDLLALLEKSPSTSSLFLIFYMSIKYFYIRVGLQARDAFFGDIKHLHPRSSNLTDQFPVKVLLEAERRYGNLLARENVDKLSIFSGWHMSLLNPRYHYTLRGYNKSGWMSVTIEMEAANQGLVYTYQRQDWNQWMPGDHIQGSRSQFCQLFNREMVGGLHKCNPGCSTFLKTIANSRVDYCPGPFLCIVYRFLNYTPATFIGPLSYRWIVFWGDLSMASRSSVLQDTDINHFATPFSEYSCAANTATVLTQKHSYHFQLAQRIPFASNTIDWEGRYSRKLDNASALNMMFWRGADLST